MDTNQEVWVCLHARHKGGHMIFATYLDPTSHEYIKHCFSGHTLPGADNRLSVYEGISWLRCELISADNESALIRIPVIADEPESFTQFQTDNGVIIRVALNERLIPWPPGVTDLTPEERAKEWLRLQHEKRKELESDIALMRSFPGPDDEQIKRFESHLQWVTDRISGPNPFDETNAVRESLIKCIKNTPDDLLDSIAESEVERSKK